MTRKDPVGLGPDELARLADRARRTLIARARRRHPRIPDADLEDIFSDTVEALLRRGEVADASHLEGALSIGMEFRAGHWHRKDGRTTPLDDAGLPEPTDSNEDPAAITARRDEQALAIELLAELEPDEQRALKLRVGEELSRSSAARAMAVDVAQLRRLERSGWKKLERIATVAQAGRLCDTRALQANEPADAAIQVAVEAHLRRCSACRRDHAARRAALAREAAGLLPLPVLLGGVAGKGIAGGLLGALGLDKLIGAGGKAGSHGSGMAAKVATATTVAVAAGGGLTFAMTSGDDSRDRQRPPQRPAAGPGTPAPPRAAAPAPATAPSRSASKRSRTSPERSATPRRSAPGAAPTTPGARPPAPAPTATPRTPRDTSPQRPQRPRPTRPTRPDRPPPRPKPSPTAAPTQTPAPTRRPRPCAEIPALVQICNGARRPPIDVTVNPGRPRRDKPVIDIGIGR